MSTDTFISCLWKDCLQPHKPWKLVLAATKRSESPTKSTSVSHADRQTRQSTIERNPDYWRSLVELEDTLKGTGCVERSGSDTFQQETKSASVLLNSSIQKV